MGDTMQPQKRLSLFLVVALALAACQSASASTSATTAPGQSSTSAALTSAPAGSTSTPNATSAPASQTSQPAPTGLPPQTSAAQIRPPERRPELERLTNLLHFKVVGLNNAALGSVSDFVINTCETYIIYFATAPDPSLNVASGKQLLVPFEAVTINSGALDAAAKSIVLQLAPSQVGAAPASPQPLQLLPNSWEQPVRDYWQKVVRIGKLSTNCGAGNGSAPTTKIAYATQLLGAQLMDGNGNLLGSVSEGIVTPESGQVEFYAVNLQNNGGTILLPLGKTNIPDDALQPGAKIRLVLLANPKQIEGAPRLTNNDAATDAAAQGAARQYWGK